MLSTQTLAKLCIMVETPQDIEWEDFTLKTYLTELVCTGVQCVRQNKYLLWGCILIIVEIGLEYMCTYKDLLNYFLGFCIYTYFYKICKRKMYLKTEMFIVTSVIMDNGWWSKSYFDSNFLGFLKSFLIWKRVP